jgi:hypothetical protein
LGAGQKPGVDTEPLPGGLVRLVPRELLVVPLAQDTANHVQRCREALIKEIKDQAGLHVWQEIRQALADLRTKAEPLQIMLSTVIERGDFKGTCDICRGYFTPPRGA